MSDGQMQVYRDGERGEACEIYFENLIRFLRESSVDNYHSLQQSAEEADSVRGGYWTGKTSFSKTLDRKLISLGEGDEISWLRLLGSVEGETYDRLKKLSPFSEKDISHINYGESFIVDSRGSLVEMVYDELRRRGYKPFNDCGNYDIVLPDKTIEKMKKLLEDAEIHNLTIRIHIVE